MSKMKLTVPTGLSLQNFPYSSIPQVVKATLDANPTLGEHDRDYLLTLLTECLKEAVEKWHRSGDKYDWTSMAVQASAFVKAEVAFSLVESLLKGVLEQSKSKKEGEDLEGELRRAREKVAATLKPKLPPNTQAQRSTQHNTQQAPSVVHAQPIRDRHSSTKDKRPASKFDPFDPSVKVPSPMEESLRKRAMDYAREHAYNLYQS